MSTDTPAIDGKKLTDGLAKLAKEKIAENATGLQTNLVDAANTAKDFGVNPSLVESFLAAINNFFQGLMEKLGIKPEAPATEPAAPTPPPSTTTPKVAERTAPAEGPNPGPIPPKQAPKPSKQQSFS